MIFLQRNLTTTTTEEKMTMIKIGNIDLKTTVDEHDIDNNNNKKHQHHLVTEVCFFVKSPHHTLAFQHLLAEKIRIAMKQKRHLRKIDYEIMSDISNKNDDGKVYLRLKKSIKSMTSLQSFMKKCKITNEWLLSHCSSYNLSISSTNKQFSRLMSVDKQPYLDGFIIPNVSKAQVIDWLPAIFGSDDAIEYVDDDDEADMEYDDEYEAVDDGGNEDPDETILTKDDIDAITSSSSFAFSPCTTAPSKFVLHAPDCCGAVM